jgi:quercetin dioxygenase-like cupin family protein
MRAMRKSLVVAGVVVCAIFLRAQGLPGVEVTAEPMHHLAFENQYVRVFKVEVPPHSATLMHRHRHDYLYVVLGAAQISNDVAGKPPAGMALQDGQVNFAAGNFSHIMRNLGSSPFRNVTIELLRDEQARKTPPAKWEEDRGLHILEGGTEDIVFVKDGARVTEFELQPGGVIPKHHPSGPHLLVAVSDLDLRSEVVGKGTSKVELKAGDIKWLPGGFTHTLSNAGKQQAKFVAVEFH